MARRYHQSRADRLDESLGERRGKESGKKQSYKARRDESRGMRGHDYKREDDRHMHRDEDHPSRHMGHGEFANMPPHEIMHEYPREKYGYGTYDDTIRGIDAVDTESADKVDDHRAHQK